MPKSKTHPALAVAELAPGISPIIGVATSITAFVGPARRGPVNRAVLIRSVNEFEARFGATTPTLETGHALRQYFLNGGRDAWVVRVAKKPNPTQLRAGLRALDAVDLFNLLVLPGLTTKAAVTLAAAYCEKRRAFLIVDSPNSARTPAEMEQSLRELANVSGSRAAIYYPWVQIADPANKSAPRLSPPSGTIAGLMARTDAGRGVWKAPAGLEATLKGVLDLSYKVTDAENGQLNRRGINCLRSFPGKGFLAWGARTLAGDDQTSSEFKYVPVRRTALFIEESISRGTKWAVFEPNDEPLWARLRQSIAMFLQGLFREGAFAGQTPKEAYFVKCDRETTTRADQNSGFVNMLVGFAPLKPAEFVVLRIRQTASQATS